MATGLLSTGPSVESQGLPTLLSSLFRWLGTQSAPACFAARAQSFTGFPVRRGESSALAGAGARWPVHVSLCMHVSVIAELKKNPKPNAGHRDGLLSKVVTSPPSLEMLIWKVWSGFNTVKQACSARVWNKELQKGFLPALTLLWKAFWKAD